MKKYVLTVSLITSVVFSLPSAHATGRMSCDSGDMSGWKSEAQLTEKIVAEGWTIRKIKEDGGCYEVYGTDPQGRRVEAYFDPLTLENLLIARRGEILYKK